MAKLTPQVFRILKSFHGQYLTLKESWISEELIESYLPIEIFNALDTIFTIREELQTEACIQFFEMRLNCKSLGSMLTEIYESIFFNAFRVCRRIKLNYESILNHPRCILFWGLIMEIHQKHQLDEKIFFKILILSIISK